MPVRLNKRLIECVTFAVFAEEYQLAPRDLAELLALAHRAFRSAEAGGGKKEEKAGRAFEAKAKEMGFGVQWPGLWPVLVKDGREVHLADVGG